MVETRWYHFIAYFFGGAFLMNTVPHLVAGVMVARFKHRLQHLLARAYRHP